MDKLQLTRLTEMALWLAEHPHWAGMLQNPEPIAELDDVLALLDALREREYDEFLLLALLSYRLHRTVGNAVWKYLARCAAHRLEQVGWEQEWADFRALLEQARADTPDNGFK